jgi:2-polyprenyl-3-methyl-5-hydroxy-6-metoxy-1,4-benzoquinol methylase
MATISRRQPKQAASTNGHDSNGHHQAVMLASSTKDRGQHSGGRRKMIVSFLSGAISMGALVFRFRDVVLCSQTVVPSAVIPTKDRGKKATATATATANVEEWKWFHGDVNQFYNELEKDHKRDPNKIADYAVHRWMGTDRSTTHHYEILYESIQRYTGRSFGMQNLTVLDAGCGLGSTMKWMEEIEPSWHIIGHTLSNEQVKFIDSELPPHKFQVALKSFDDLETDSVYDVIYSIEAMIHSVDIQKTLKAWAEHLNPKHGSLIIIDDFLMPSAAAERNTTEIQLFQRGWMANTLYTVTELNNISRRYGLELVESRDVLAEFRVVELNYRNKVPPLSVEGTRSHQGWIGSKFRHKLTVEGKIGYFMLVFRRRGAKKPNLKMEQPPLKLDASNPLQSTTTRSITTSDESTCASVPTASESQQKTFANITSKDECISSWYCCDKHKEYLHKLDTKRTHTHGFLVMDKSLFGNYMEAFAKHLTLFYQSIPADYKSGRFLDIGATGSTASGMTQVTSKFAHFAGPSFEYWMLDSDQGAKSLNRTIYCDICNCPQGESCGFDVTFSHTVLEHASRPEKAFDTIARLTKKGGLTMHLVPWSYQYHATPDDYYRFSHAALKVLVSRRKPFSVMAAKA